MSATINKLKNGAYQVLDGGLVYSTYTSREQAKKVAKQLDEDNAISEYIDDELFSLRQSLASRFGVSMDEAYKMIKESL